jgi:membrane-associated phospholipid phosphatase
MLSMPFKPIVTFIILVSCCFSAAAQDTIPSLDLRLLEHLNHAAGPGDKKWLRVSNSLNFVGFATPVLLEATGFASNNNQLKNDGLVSGASLILTSAVTYSLKIIFKRKRPYLAYPRLITGKAKETTYSFPSGHTSVAFATATVLSLSFPKWYVITPAYSYAILVAYSRSYLGVHYPGDILAGAIIGTSSSLLTWRLQRSLHIGFTLPIK